MSISVNVTREQLLELRQPSDVVLSQDGQRIAFVVSATSIEAGQALPSRIWSGPAEGPVRQVTRGPGVDALPRFSPDGSRLAFASDRDHFGRLSLYLLDHGSEARPHGEITGSVEAIQWSDDGLQLFVLAADMGSESAGVNISKVIEEADATEPDPLVKRPNLSWRRLFRVDAASGETVAVSPRGVNVWEFMSHPKAIVAVVSEDPSENAWYDAYVGLIDHRRQPMHKVYSPQWQLQSAQLSPDGTRVALVEGLCSDRLLVSATIKVVDLASGEAKELAPGRDVTSVWWVGNERLAFVGRRGLESHCGFVSLTGDVDEVWSGPAQLGQLHLTALAADRASHRFAAAKDALGEPPEVYVMDTTPPGGAWRAITSLNEALKGLPVPDARRLTWNADDGLEIEGLVLQPPGGNGDPLPLVVMVHGGPTANWSYNFAAGYLGHGLCFANAGYAVLLPNPRGSSGRGQDFARANLGDLGGGDFRDILAGVDACVAAGIADTDRVGITGVSGGGLMSAWAVTQTDRFAASIPVSCVSNWLSFHNTANVGRSAELLLQADPYDPVGNYFKLSPVVHCRSVSTPTLIMHGAIDLVTPQGQAQEFYHALADVGCVTELVIYPREGHGHAWIERDHLVDCWRRMHEWFDRHLCTAKDSNPENASEELP